MLEAGGDLIARQPRQARVDHRRDRKPPGEIGHEPAGVIAREKTRFTTARVVSNRYSIMKAGQGSASEPLEGCRPGWTNTTALRSSSAASSGSNRASPRKFSP